MRKGLHIGTFFRIPVYIHWTFSFLLLFIGYTAFKEGMDFQETIWLFIVFLSVFVCVILHEYGHALTARRYGISTLDIILTPIGGIARLQGMPKRPWREFLVAIAGPLVNVVIALLLLPVLYFFSLGDLDQMVSESGDLVIDFNSFWIILFALNVMLFVFNLIPAFPLDGGRIFRALLSLKFNRGLATKIAARLGQVFAVAFIGVGLWNSSFSLAFIGVFVIFSAQRELSYVIQSEGGKYRNKTIEAFVRKDYHVFYESQPLWQFIHADAKYPNVTSYLVLSNANKIIGEVSFIEAQKAIEAGKIFDTISEYMKPHSLRLPIELNPTKVKNIMTRNDLQIVPIIKNGETIGVIDYFTIYSVS